MNDVYLLQHSYQYGASNEFEEVKILGIYSSEAEANSAIHYYKKLIGFKDFPEECFSVDRYELNKGEWLEGFITV